MPDRDRLGISRREWLRGTALGAALALGGAGPVASTTGQPAGRRPDPHRPNVLFVVIDDLNDWVGAMRGHPQARTPNLDRLARRGVLFQRAYCQVPLCNPSRTSVLSGLRPTTFGGYHNDIHWREAVPAAVSLPRYFKEAGYRVLGGGKVFHQPPREHAADWHEYEEAGPDPGRAGPDTGEGRLDWGPLAVEDEETSDTRLALWGAGVLRRDHDRPFFIALGLQRPHMPWFVPRKYFDMFPPETVRLPAVLEGDLEDVPKSAVLRKGMHDYDRVLARRAWPQAVGAYLACVAYTDANVGRLLGALDASPYASNTVVALWSDNGFQLGEKRHFRKDTLWEPSCRVPLIVAGPGVTAGEPSWRTVELLDLYPTLLELCGLPRNPTLEGVSLGPLLRHPGARWHRPAISSRTAHAHSVRTERWRYTRYRDGGEELYDHDHDPHEWRNLADRLAYGDLKRQLSAMLPRVSEG